MKKLLQLEEAVMFGACLYFFPHFDLSWWWLIGCILLPDIGMVGYALNAKTGAYTYNVLHHRGVAIAVILLGILAQSTAIQFAGYILLTHACMDRMLGYGLKYEKGFKYTHLGEIGKDKTAETSPNF